MAKSLQLYDRLMQFTLFQGMGYSDLMQMVAHTKFDFIKLPPGKRVIRNGEPCRCLYFLLNGRLKTEIKSDDNSYSVTEEIDAPFVIQPERIFGIAQRYRGTVHTLSDVNFIAIDKKEVMALSESIIVFRLNLFNIFAAQSQRLLDARWRQCHDSLRSRITDFIASRCQHPVGPKVMYIYMEQLAREMNDSRLDVSRALNAMQADGLVTLGRGRIVIPSLERLTGQAT